MSRAKSPSATKVAQAACLCGTRQIKEGTGGTAVEKAGSAGQQAVQEIGQGAQSREQKQSSRLGEEDQSGMQGWYRVNLWHTCKKD